MHGSETSVSLQANALQPGACYVGMRRRIEEVRGKKQRMQISTFNVLTAPFLEKARVEVERRHLAANIL